MNVEHVRGGGRSITVADSDDTTVQKKILCLRSFLFAIKAI